ncbi:MAG: hypothetical protein QW584_03775, partial [Thermofilaceae archaeon]
KKIIIENRKNNRKSTRARGFRGFSLPMLGEKDPELYSYIESIVHRSSWSNSSSQHFKPYPGRKKEISSFFLL